MHMTCKYFSIRELIPPPEDLPERLLTVYNSNPDELFRLFPWQFLVTLDRLRKLFGPATVNNWEHYAHPADAPYRFSGFRSMECTVGAELSEHRFSRAADMKFRDATPEEVWAQMVHLPDRMAFEFVERVEAYEGMTWVHWDMGQHDRNRRAIRVITPTDNRAGLPEYIERAF
jgi:hypothetical protein